MANRRLACAWETLKQFAPAAPLMWIVRRLIETAPLDYAYGIAVMDFNYDSSDNDAFVQCTVEAMALIKQHDQMRFRRLQHHVRFIVNTEIPYSRGEYHWYGRMVHVDFQVSGVYPGTEDYWWHLAQYAALLVHEATHARLRAEYFPYTKRTRVRVERICSAEARRFLVNWSAGRFVASSLAPKFDPARWHRSWYGSRVQRARELWRRFRISEGEYERRRPLTVVGRSGLPRADEW